MTKVAIIIVHYNTEEETRDCLLSLKKIKTDGLDVSTIVVDNGSKELLEVAEAQRPAKTIILRSDSNLGFTSGNNLGINHAFQHLDPEYILLLNSDTLVEPNFLKQLVSCAQEKENMGLITPLIYFAPGREFHNDSYTQDQEGKVIWYAGGSIDWPHLDAFHRGIDEVDQDHFSHDQVSDFATGCCALIPRKVLDQVGLFDPNYFLYLEDVDLSLRIARAGYEIHMCPHAKIWHINAGSSGGAGSALGNYYQTRNRLFFFNKYAPNKIRLTLWKFAARLLFKGTAIERRAATDWLMGRMGKQPIL
jgi:GT2 family glycosyltransferase